MSVLSSNNVVAELCRAFGINPSNVRSIVIRAEVNAAVELIVTRFAEAANLADGELDTMVEKYTLVKKTI